MDASGSINRPLQAIDPQVHLLECWRQTLSSSQRQPNSLSFVPDLLRSLSSQSHSSDLKNMEEGRVQPLASASTDSPPPPTPSSDSSMTESTSLIPPKKGKENKKKKCCSGPWARLGEKLKIKVPQSLIKNVLHGLISYASSLAVSAFLKK